MLTKRAFSSPFPPKGRRSGIALIITLALLVLISISVIAFLSSTLSTQEAGKASVSGQEAEALSRGVTQSIIASLRREMIAPEAANGSGITTNSISGSFIMTPPANVDWVPSRCINPSISTTSANPPDPTAAYAAYANLVKQSLSGVNLYTLPNAKAPSIASEIATTQPAVDGRFHSATFWNLPQLISATPSSVLVPDWVYMTRSGSNPTAYGNNAEQSQVGVTSNPNFITGRYAYNIYDIGGLLNANVAGYPATTTPYIASNTTPAPTPVALQVVPGYKGSALAADLSGLTLNGTTQYLGKGVSAPSTGWDLLPQWRTDSGPWTTPTTTTGSSGFGFQFASGELNGWLNETFGAFDLNGQNLSSGGADTFLIPGASPLFNNNFTSRQDLINWVTNQWGSTAVWTLPYLTHFSFDTDAPTYSPDPNRPTILNTAAAGGNDGQGSDMQINPSLTSVLDVNGNPLIKRRFPLSALALVNQFDPTNGGPASGTLYNQIKYDFGLVWDTQNNCWDYQDWEGNTAGIKRLEAGGVGTVPNTRSPNFFELLKAAIVAGSLGKQFGTTPGYYASTHQPGWTQGEPSVLPGVYANLLGSSKYSSIDYQVVQIGANILSQANPNFIPTDILINGTHLWGVTDLPYLYGVRYEQYPIGKFSGTTIAYSIKSKDNSYLGAEMIHPELWAPHAPNAVVGSPANAKIPKYFRIVPETFDNPIYVEAYNIGGGLPFETTTNPPPNASSGEVYNPSCNWQGLTDPTSNYLPIKFANCTNETPYDNAPGDSNFAYLQTTTPWSPTDPTANSFREPVPLMMSNFPAGLTSNLSPSLTWTTSGPWNAGPQTDLKLMQSTQVLDNSIFGQGSTNNVLGFLVGYFAVGPSGNPNGYDWFPWIQNLYSSSVMSLTIYYSFDQTNWYPYDQMDSVFDFTSSLLGTFVQAAPNGTYQMGEVDTRFDPRTDRWGLMPGIAQSSSASDYLSGRRQGLTAAPYVNPSTSSFTVNPNHPDVPIAPGWTWDQSGTSQIGALQSNNPSGTTYYQDPDGVVRPADAYWAASNYNPPGYPLRSAQSPSGGTLSDNPVGNYNSRPVILHRPFQSVAELGYVFRGTPFKSLDFLDPQSGDVALLDVFSAYGPDPWSYASSTYNAAATQTANTFVDENGLVAGRVNLNTQQPPVLAALLKSDIINTPTSPTAVTLDDATATSIAQALAAYTATSGNDGPLTNRAELVGKYVSGAGTSSLYRGFSSSMPALLKEVNGGNLVRIKQQAECAMHALADVGTTRTWNLLIDLVAQSGHLVPGANTLDRFVVNGERHVWVSVAIDRVTGKVIKIQNEPVRL